MQDFETAEVAFHAALTGHLVSTLHTNSAIATIARLFDLGLKPYVVATALEGLLPSVWCGKSARCVVKRSLWILRYVIGSAVLLPQLSIVHRGKGCSNCHGSGYKGESVSMKC